jgi:hypothetical protein
LNRFAKPLRVLEEYPFSYRGHFRDVIFFPRR